MNYQNMSALFQKLKNHAKCVQKILGCKISPCVVLYWSTSGQWRGGHLVWEKGFSPDVNQTGKEFKLALLPSQTNFLPSSESFSAKAYWKPQTFNFCVSWQKSRHQEYARHSKHLHCSTCFQSTRRSEHTPELQETAQLFAFLIPVIQVIIILSLQNYMTLSHV